MGGNKQVECGAGLLLSMWLTALSAAQPMEAVNARNFFPMHGMCGTVLLLRDLLLSKPRDGLKSIGSLIWLFIAVCEKEVRMGSSD